jgi:galactokinase
VASVTPVARVLRSIRHACFARRLSADNARGLFRATYGAEPTVITSAPGRVNLIGEHTDYNGGEVLPIAIGLRTYVAVGPAAGSSSRAVSSAQSSSGAFRIADPAPAGAWWDYVHGSLRELTLGGVALPAVDCAIVSDVPLGAGLSSSAALEVATVLAGVIVSGARVIDVWDDIAAIAHRAESRFVGVACGIMDQTVSAFAAEGYALRIWCDSGRYEQVPWPASRRVLIVDTASPRALRASAFNERQAECAEALGMLRLRDPAVRHLAHATVDLVEQGDLPSTLRRRARHVVTESARVARAVRALESGEPLGALLAESHASLRDEYQCSSPELDWVVDHAAALAGVDGARMTGAGWGGCAIVVGAGEALAAVAPELAEAFERQWGRTPRWWVTGAEEGLDVEFHVD